jgi:hypothetical protein
MQNIEFWLYNFSMSQWSQITSLNYTSYYGYSCDLIIIDGTWHLFWDGTITENYTEIFTVSFDPLTNTWSNITQITEANLFTDDYIISRNTSLLFIYPLLGFVILFIINKKMR